MRRSESSRAANVLTGETDPTNSAQRLLLLRDSATQDGSFFNELGAVDLVDHTGCCDAWDKATAAAFKTKVVPLLARRCVQPSSSVAACRFPGTDSWSATLDGTGAAASWAAVCTRESTLPLRCSYTEAHADPVVPVCRLGRYLLSPLSDPLDLAKVCVAGHFYDVEAGSSWLKLFMPARSRMQTQKGKGFIRTIVDSVKADGASSSLKLLYLRPC